MMARTSSIASRRRLLHTTTGAASLLLLSGSSSSRQLFMMMMMHAPAPTTLVSSLSSDGGDATTRPGHRSLVGFPRGDNDLDLAGKMILAPLTRGGNLPYRRLCADFGCDVTYSEMVYARSLLAGSPVERARLRRADNERCFGVQIATNNVDEGIAAMRLIQEEAGGVAPPDFVDLNCGCPINEATRRGLGSSLLRSPKKLGRLVAGMVDGMAPNGGMPLTVKIRLGCEDDTINVEEVVRTLGDAGAAAIAIHGRTAQSRYSKPNNWEMIRSVVENNNNRYSRSGADDDDDNCRRRRVPIIGNGDILTHYEARMRMEQSGVDAVMVGRGALVKPWIFKEHSEGMEYLPDLRERVGIYRTLSLYMKDHFGDDDKGRKKSMFFFPWHFEFLCRYQPFPEEEYGVVSRDAPLIQMRDNTSSFRGGGDNMLSPLEVLLSCRSREAHVRIADCLWEAESDAEAFDRLMAFAEGHDFRQIQDNDTAFAAEMEELANIPRRNGHDDRRRGRNPKPKRSPEEIRIVRAERAAKKAAARLAESGGLDLTMDGGRPASSPLGPLKDQPGVIKRWITSGRTGQKFGFIGAKGLRGEYIVFDDDLDDSMLPIDESALPISVYFDTEMFDDDPAKSDRAVNVRLA